MNRHRWFKQYAQYIDELDAACREAGIGPILPDAKPYGWQRRELAENGIASSRLEELAECDPLIDLVESDDVDPAINRNGDPMRFSRDEIEPEAGAVDQLRDQLRIVDPWPWNIDPDRFAVRERRLRA